MQSFLFRSIIDDVQWTPLHYASDKDKEAVIQLMIEREKETLRDPSALEQISLLWSDPVHNKRDKRGSTPVFLARSELLRSLTM